MKTRRLTKREELIWLSAFFEAEGCIHLIANKHRDMRSGYQYSIRISVGQNHKQPLLRFQERFGGRISERVQQEKFHSWHWVCATAQAVAAIREMRPFLETKREQAELAIVFQVRRKPRGGVPRNLSEAEVLRDKQDFEKMKALKRIRY